VWAAASTALIALLGIIFYAETISYFKISGITLIVVGVVLLNLTNR
jgi:small multidrug resistance pump